MSEQKPRSLLKEFREGRSEFFKVWGPGLLIALLGFGVAWFFVEPAPPDTVVLLSGPKDGAYYAFAQRYREVFEKNGVTLEVRTTAGSIENYRTLLAEGTEAHVAIVQGGTAPEEPGQKLISLASLYLEPVWVFYRGERTLDDPTDLAGMRVAVGREGSGARAVALELLAECGVVEVGEAEESDSLVARGGADAVEALLAGEVDAAFFVISPGAESVQRLLRSEDVRLMSFARAEAFSRRMPFLSHVTLPEGAIDLKRNVPEKDVSLVAPAAALVATPGLHKALIPLFLQAAEKAHEQGDLFSAAGEFPSKEYLPFALADESRRWFEEGPSFLYAYLPFWVASFIDRTKILLLPLVTLLFPLFRVAPPVLQWRIRSRVFRWYDVLREIDETLLKGKADEGTLRRRLETLDQLEQELDEVSVPLSYMAEYYHLRVHIGFIRDRIHARLKQKAEEDASEDAAKKGDA